MGDLSFVIVGLVAIGIAAICRSRGIMPALPLIATGALLSFVPGLSGISIDPTVVLALLLAPLVFAAGLKSSYLDLKSASRPILSLSIGLVIVTTLTIGVVVWAVVPVISFPVGCCIGAVLASTDAVAASTIGRTVGLPRRVLVVLEGESLVNDGTSLTALRVAVAVVVAGSVTIAQVGGMLLQAVVFGVAVGAIVGWLVSAFLSRLRDPVVSNALLLLAPFLVYLVAEELHGSGLLAVVVTGVWVAHTRTASTRFETRLQSDVVWNEVSFLLESFAFLVVGLETRLTIHAVDTQTRHRLYLLILLVVVVIAATRILFVGAAALMRRLSHQRHQQFTWRENMVVGWSGARGPVSILAAFSLPVTLNDGSPFPNRQVVLVVTCGVVVVTLLQGLTLKPLIRRLGLTADNDEVVAARAKRMAADAAVSRLDALLEEADMSGVDVPAQLVNRLRSRTKGRPPAISDASRAKFTVTYSLWRREMLNAERDELIRMRDRGELPDAVLRDLLSDIDRRMATIGRSASA